MDVGSGAPQQRPASPGLPPTALASQQRSAVTPLLGTNAEAHETQQRNCDVTSSGSRVEVDGRYRRHAPAAVTLRIARDLVGIA